MCSFTGLNIPEMKASTGTLLFALGHMVLCAAVPVVPLEFKEAKQPQVTVDQAGNAFVAFGQADSLFCSVSPNGAKTFLQPVKIGKLDKLALGMRRGPRIVSAGDHQIVSAISSGTGDLSVWLSDRDGAQWRARGVVNDVPRAAREGLHAMASDGNKRAFLVWLDLRHGQTEIWGALSEDGGKTWGKNIPVYRSPDRTVCECCHPGVKFTRDGKIIVMWRNWLGGARDMYLSQSSDGLHFENAQKLGTGTWPLKGCPMDGGSLASAADGSIAAVWRRADSIFVTVDSIPERPLGKGIQPVAFYSKDHFSFVWQQDSRLLLQNDLPASQSKILADDARYAAAAEAPDGTAIVVWENTRSEEARILAEVVR